MTPLTVPEPMYQSVADELADLMRRVIAMRAELIVLRRENARLVADIPERPAVKVGKRR